MKIRSIFCALAMLLVTPAAQAAVLLTYQINITFSNGALPAPASFLEYWYLTDNIANAGAGGNWPYYAQVSRTDNSFAQNAAAVAGLSTPASASGYTQTTQQFYGAEWSFSLRDGASSNAGGVSRSYLSSIGKLTMGSLGNGSIDRVATQKFSLGDQFSYQVSGSQSAPGNSQSVQYQGTATLLAVDVPEPATWAMMIVGFGVVGGVMRRRERAIARG